MRERGTAISNGPWRAWKPWTAPIAIEDRGGGRALPGPPTASTASVRPRPVTMARMLAGTIGWSLTMPEPTRLQRMSLITQSQHGGEGSPASPPSLPLRDGAGTDPDAESPRRGPRPSVHQLLDAESIISAELVEHGAVVVHRSVLPDQCSACGRLRGHTLFEHQARVIKTRLEEAGLMASGEPASWTIALVGRGVSTAVGQYAATSLQGVRARALGDLEVPSRG